MYNKTETHNVMSDTGTTPTNPDPIEPEKNVALKISILKFLLFLFVVVYFLLSYFHASIFIQIGKYLILEHPPEKSDLIICLAGGNIERGLATADAYNAGWASSVFISRERVPDGFELLKEKGVEYPESIDLMGRLLANLGVPESSIIKGEVPVNSTLGEASVIRDEIEKRGYKSAIVITSPQHTRRSWIAYEKVFEGTDVKILMLASTYSGFRPDNWWKERQYMRDVIMEYQKLIYYVLKY